MNTLLLLFTCILAAALFFNLLWASSYSLNWPLDKPHPLVISNYTPNVLNFKKVDVKEKKLSEELISPTFADLPAPELVWEKMTSAPVPRLDGFAVQIKNLFYVFAGYGTIDVVHSHVDVYNFTDDTWVDRFDMPKEMANSHLGMATDGRYIYAISGQYGPQCRGPTARTFVLDTKTKKWGSMPPLPAPRYAPATQLWRGRLHVMGGSKENRHSPGVDHWSLAVKIGKALEKEWRSETPIPRGGTPQVNTTAGDMFCAVLNIKEIKAFVVRVFSRLLVLVRACVALDAGILVIGGQEGDFMAKPGSPIFKCSRRHEVVYPDVYKLDAEMKWKVSTPMPKPDSHIESSWVVVNNSLIIVGGTTEKHPVTKRMILVGEVFQFHLDSEKWSVLGKLPFRCKTTLAAFWDGWLYFTSGQRDRGPDNPQPRKVIGEMWRTKLS